MAWVFSLSAECGSEKVAAESFSQHFDNLIFTLSNSIQAQCKTTLFQDLEDNWWCRVSPENVSELGVDSPDVAYTMTELGILLYQRLRSAPPFRYALVGVEVDEFRTYHELISEPSKTRLPGLVVAIDVWKLMESSSAFELGRWVIASQQRKAGMFMEPPSNLQQGNRGVLSQQRKFRASMKSSSVSQPSGWGILNPQHQVKRPIESSSPFRPFRSGYVWQPYEGEIYRPLTVSPDLKAKLNELMVLA